LYGKRHATYVKVRENEAKEKVKNGPQGKHLKEGGEIKVIDTMIIFGGIFVSNQENDRYIIPAIILATP